MTGLDIIKIIYEIVYKRMLKI